MIRQCTQSTSIHTPDKESKFQRLVNALFVHFLREADYSCSKETQSGGEENSPTQLRLQDYNCLPGFELIFFLATVDGRFNWIFILPFCIIGITDMLALGNAIHDGCLQRVVNLIPLSGNLISIHSPSPTICNNGTNIVVPRHLLALACIFFFEEKCVLICEFKCMVISILVWVCQSRCFPPPFHPFPFTSFLFLSV